jgi:hypothetical protein
MLTFSFFQDSDVEEAALQRAADLYNEEYAEWLLRTERDEQFERDMVTMGDADQVLEDDDRGQRAEVDYPDALDVAVPLCRCGSAAEGWCGSCREYDETETFDDEPDKD